MRWNKQAKPERPEYPKLVPIEATAEQVRNLLSAIQQSDPAAAMVDSGSHGTYIRVHNEAAEEAARLRS